MGKLNTLQVDPGVKEFSLYNVMLDDNVQLGLVLVAKTTYEQYEANYEYWSLTSEGLAAVAESQTMTWEGESYDWSELDSTAWPGEEPLAMFHTPATVEWEEIEAPRNVFATNEDPNATLDFGLTYDAGEWCGQLNWGQTGEDEYVVKNGETVFRLTETPSGESWTGATTTPAQS